MKKPGGTLNGFLDQGCSIKGDIVFADLLRVHGQASGTVRSDGELLVGEGGVVEGEIMVARLRGGRDGARDNQGPRASGGPQLRPDHGGDFDACPGGGRGRCGRGNREDDGARAAARGRPEDRLQGLTARRAAA